jgi:hypothetical protein
MKKLFQILGVAMVVIAIMLSVFSMAVTAKPNKPEPICELICEPFPPPIYVNCYIYCPPLYP